DRIEVQVVGIAVRRLLGRVTRAARLRLDDEVELDGQATSVLEGDGVAEPLFIAEVEGVGRAASAVDLPGPAIDRIVGADDTLAVATSEVLGEMAGESDRIR